MDLLFNEGDQEPATCYQIVSIRGTQRVINLGDYPIEPQSMKWNYRGAVDMSARRNTVYQCFRFMHHRSDARDPSSVVRLAQPKRRVTRVLSKRVGKGSKGCGVEYLEYDHTT